MTGRARLRDGLLVLLATVLATTAVLSALEVRADSAAHDGRAAAVHAAERQVVALLSVSARSSDADLARLTEGATSSFRDEIRAHADAFRAAIRKGAVEATGAVSSAGVVSWADDRARVLVAARGTVRNTSTKRAQPRAYRLQVDLRRVSGRWLVSGLEFVP